jgi:hypothetical protein
LYGVFHASVLQAEESAGLGLGVSLLLLVSLAASVLIPRRSARPANGQAMTLWWKLVIWSPWLSLLVFGLKAQVVSSSARLINPYYAILMVPLLIPVDGQLMRRCWWKCLAGAVIAMAAILIIITPARPLWPARHILAELKKSHPDSSMIARAQVAFSVYSDRSACFAPLIAALPPDARILGLVTFDDPEASLWWPLGSRRIEHVTSADTRQNLEARGIRYVVLSSHSFALQGTIEDLLRKFDAEKIKTVPLLLRAGEGVTDWYILELKPQNSSEGVK